VRAAAIQLSAGPDKSANTAVAVHAVEDAIESGAQLVVLPEAAMAGFGDPGTDLVALAEPLDGPFVEALRRCVAGSPATVVAGMFEAAEPSAGNGRRVYNTVVAVGPSGLIGRYRKLHLYDALGWCESDRVIPGDTDVPALVFGVAGQRVGVMTCYDLRFPESARRLVDIGATVVVVPAAWVAGPLKVDQWEVLLRARAIESTAYVVGAAQPAPEFTGCSMVVDPLGSVLGSLGATGSGCLMADLDIDLVERTRAAMPVLANRRFAVVPAPR
jgi:predicted amidohydrolase